MIYIINYGTGNIKSIERAISLLGYEYKVVEDIKSINKATHLILPGVGSFKTAISYLKEKNFDQKIIEASNNNIGLIGICLGMQLLLDSSLENGYSKGLSLIPGKVIGLKELCDTEKVPHIGWNKIYFNDNKITQKTLENQEFYFLHSFFCAPENKENILTVTNFGEKRFCSSLHFKNIAGSQFHPEKSRSQGHLFIKYLLELTR